MSGADVKVTSSSEDPHRIIGELNKLAATNVTDTGCHVKVSHEIIRSEVIK